MTTLWRDDIWLAQHLGVRSVELYPEALQSPFELPFEVQNAFVYARVPLSRLDILYALNLLGFVLVDTSITLERHVKSREVGNPAIRYARPQDRELVVELARYCFSYTRFHQDHRISRTTADTIQAAWADNFFLGNRGDLMLIAEDSYGIQGFLLALVPSQEKLIIDLIGVSKNAQGKGLGRALIDSAQTETGCALVQAGSQLVNMQALAFYQRMGFHLVKAVYTLHRHPSIMR